MVMVEGQVKKGRPIRTVMMQIEEESMKVVLSRDDALLQLDWSESGPPYLLGILQDFKHWPIFLGM